jgi:trehalose-phosphatase
MARGKHRTANPARPRSSRVSFLHRAGGGNLRHLWENWTAVGRRLRTATQIALFLDFDGTLAPICPHPEEVEFAPSTRRVLRRLARHAGVKVFVISGRRMADVRRRVKVSHITFLGLHGWERGDGKPKETETYKFMQHLRREVEARLAGLEGIWVEDKFISFVVHYRRAPTAVRRGARTVLREFLVTEPFKVRLMEGKKVWEILPHEVKGKGAAVREILNKLNGRPLPIYVGDDTTDEAAFSALPRGITVRVGAPRRTQARYHLCDSDEVRQFLEKLEGEIS